MMAATFEFRESNGAGETVTNNISNVNFGSNDSANIVPATFPITAGTNSFEKWIRGHFSGTYASVTNLKFWKSAGAYVTGEDIKAAVNATYATPTASTSSVATVTVPTTLGTALAPTAPGASPSFSGYITMQLQTTGSTPAGSVNQKTFTLQFFKKLLLAVTLIENFAVSVKTLLKEGQYRGNLLMQRVRRDYTRNVQFGYIG